MIGGAGFGLALALVGGARSRRRSARGTCGSSCTRRWLRAARACAAAPRGSSGASARRGPAGQVFLDGALWRARQWSFDEEAVLERGDPIVVERVDGLTLTVRRAEDWEVF